MGLQSVKRANDLITTEAEVRSGFLRQAKTKAQKSKAYIDRAHAFRESLKSVSTLSDLTKQVVALGQEILAAVGFSDKASSHFDSTQKEASVTEILTSINLDESLWREQLVERFLLTSGDSLGGAMRNWTGAQAQRQLVGQIVDALTAKGLAFVQYMDTEDRQVTRALDWDGRVLVLNKEGIDLILLSHGAKILKSSVEYITAQNVSAKFGRKYGKGFVKDRTRYLACGELKGGIDPAGADEHWKTASKAFDRIRDKFTLAKLPLPKLFFVGASIEARMASEIFTELQTGRLECAANLTSASQRTELAKWLVAL